MKPERVCEVSLKFRPSNTITFHPHSLKTITRSSLYFSSFLPLLRLIIICLLEKLVGTSIQDCMKIISKAKERAPNHPSPPFKKKEKGGEGGSKAWWSMEDPMLGGQWKIPCLVVNGRFHVWWSMEGSMLGAQWKIPCLVLNGRSHAWCSMEDPMLGAQWKIPCLVAHEMEKHLFTSSISP